jgi:hypothetical protein
VSWDVRQILLLIVSVIGLALIAPRGLSMERGTNLIGIATMFCFIELRTLRSWPPGFQRRLIRLGLDTALLVGIVAVMLILSIAIGPAPGTSPIEQIPPEFAGLILLLFLVVAISQAVRAFARWAGQAPLRP